MIIPCDLTDYFVKLHPPGAEFLLVGASRRLDGADENIDVRIYFENAVEHGPVSKFEIGRGDGRNVIVCAHIYDDDIWSAVFAQIVDPRVIHSRRDIGFVSFVINFGAPSGVVQPQGCFG